MDNIKKNLLEYVSNQISKGLENNPKWEWGISGRFIRFVIPVGDISGDSVSINVMYHENKERRFKVEKINSFWYILDTEKDQVVKEYSNITIANAICEKYNRYHENQGWDQFKRRGEKE